MRLLLAACALVVMAAGLATAQQPSVTVKSSGVIGLPPSSLWSLLLREEVQKDLGTSDEVASKLKSLRDDSRAALQKEYRDAGVSLGNTSTMTVEQRRKFSEIVKKIDEEFSAKGKELLTADQNKRLAQIQLQFRLKVEGAMATLAPDVASELKLTADQRGTLDSLRKEYLRGLLPRGGDRDREAVETNTKNRELANTKMIDVLTIDQKEALNKLKGKEFDLSSFIISVGAPPMAQQKNEATVETGRIHPDFIVTLAANAAVQKDLGVSDEVAKKLVSMRRQEYQQAEAKALEEVGVVDIQSRMQMTTYQWAKFNAIAKKVHEGFLPKLRETLTAEQFQRLIQIQLQNALNHDGPKALLAPEFANDLKLTDTQSMQFDALGKEFARGAPFQLINGRTRFSMSTWVAHGKEYRAKAIELLTAEQKEALSKLEGKEFDLAPLVNLSRPIPPRE